MATFPLCINGCGDSTLIVDAVDSMTVGEFIDVVAKKADLVDSDLFLHTGVANLSELEWTLADYGLTTPFSTVFVSGRLRGGKVHGSLARAGKVRGQTPKVEKGEKKKKKTGRAKRRLQYTRRFVNKVETFGRRRGPNSNADAGKNAGPQM